jgi:hypothetical protein
MALILKRASASRPSGECAFSPTTGCKIVPLPPD